MPLKLFTKEATELPKPLLSLDPETLSILCVNQHGLRLCTLFAINTVASCPETVLLTTCSLAKERLEKEGYDTSWGRWGRNGEFMEYARD